MTGLNKVQYYNQDGTMDWLRTIVRTVYYYTCRQGTVFVASVAAQRAQRLYYKKTDIRKLFKGQKNG